MAYLKVRMVSKHFLMKLFVMENFCCIGNDEYYGYNFTDIIIQKIIIHCCIPLHN